MVKDDARRAAYVYGLRAETAATLWLRARLYQILARNFGRMAAKSTLSRSAAARSSSSK
ncbi:MAG: hypothetical protein WBO09_20020 [Methylocystis silviterrae]|uniref:hypothetical protein n=1 Tax=Methylocystis silviterrae TaxID=2743612 RepID=UPI003C73776C